jgi:hypothetical protein
MNGKRLCVFFLGDKIKIEKFKFKALKHFRRQNSDRISSSTENFQVSSVRTRRECLWLRRGVRVMIFSFSHCSLSFSIWHSCPLIFPISNTHIFLFSLDRGRIYYGETEANVMKTYFRIYNVTWHPHRKF